MTRPGNDFSERLSAVAIRLVMATVILAGIAIWRQEQNSSRYAHPGRVMTLAAQQSDCSRSSLFATGAGCQSALSKITFLNSGKK